MIAPLVIAVVYWFANQNSLSPIFANLIAVLVPVDLLVVLGLMVFGFIDHYFDVYIITDRRIVDIVQNGFFKREISEVNLRQIQDVKAQVDGVFPTLLHFGDIHIQTAGEMPNFFFASIPHPYEVSKRILDLHEAYVKNAMGKNGEFEEDIYDERPIEIEAIRFPKTEKEMPKEASVELRPSKEEKFEGELDEEGELREGQEIDL